MRDVAAAKELVAQAGAQGLTVPFDTIGGRPKQIVDIVASAAREIGLKPTIAVRDPAAHFAGFPGWYGATDSVPSLPIMSIAAIYDAPGATYNGTFFDDAEYAVTWNVAVSAMTDEERAAPLHTMQKVLFDRGGYLIPAFSNTLAAHVAGATGWPTRDYSGIQIPIELNKVSLTS